MPRTPMPEQDPHKRINNFDEVCLGYTEEQAIEEAKRCLQCKDPRCVKKCPVNINIPGFIKNIIEDDPDSALEIIKQTNNLPGVCGRVCPQERQCEFGCVLKLKEEEIAIGKLERYAADHGKIKKAPKRKSNKYKVAVVGSGPAGLTCASDLNKLGYDVTIFEALHVTGGVLRYGIPTFRLPHKIVEDEIRAIENEGVAFKKNYVIGRTLSMQEMQESFDAIFISTGAGLPFFLNIPGEDLINVYSANEYLTRVNLMESSNFPKYTTPVRKAEKTIVVGCGNTAIDAARTAKRLGSDVTVVYRRSIIEAPARQEEIKHAQEEGIHFMFLTQPVRILGKTEVEGVELIQMMLTEEEGGDGRKRPAAIENSEFPIECDQLIIAVGKGPNPVLTKDNDFVTNDSGKLVVDERLRTNLKGVFAGGDIIDGEETVIRAMGDGKRAAMEIDSYLNNS